jgi:hypothetical protein
MKQILFFLSICPFFAEASTSIDVSQNKDNVVIEYVGVSSNTCGSQFTALNIKSPSSNKSRRGEIRIHFEQVSDLQEAFCGQLEKETHHKTLIPMELLEKGRYHVVVIERFNITQAVVAVNK